MKDYVIFDIEADGLLPSASKIHCVSYYIINKDVKNTIITDFEKFFSNPNTVFIGHNIIRYDIRLIKKLLGITINLDNVIDTLGLSWYLFPYLDKHGLEYWGDEFNTPKIEIKDWNNLTIEEYCKRCERDVEINSILYKKLSSYLYNIYERNGKKGENIIRFLNFKLSCLAIQEYHRININKYNLRKYFHELDFIKIKKTLILDSSLPKVIDKERPKKYLNKDGKLSVLGEKWIEELRKRNLPEDTEIIYKKGNSNSSEQVKNWLFSLGWKPNIYKLSKQTGNQVPQISEEGELTKSVEKLIEKDKNILELKSLSRISHRLGILKAFIKSVDEDEVYSTAHGLTNTLRLKHSNPFVNLPKPKVFYGKEIRSLIIPKENNILCGIDIKGLEATTADHFIYFFDPEYVKEKQKSGFDPHLHLGVIANLITQEESDFYKDIKAKLEKEESISDSDKKLFEEIDTKRFISKTTNFSLIYGAGAKKLSETLDISLSEAKKLYEAFWKVNNAIRLISKSLDIIEVGKQKWLYNPVSKFYYFLKAEKDAFSTLNQGTGDFVFNLFLKLLLENTNSSYQYLDNNNKMYNFIFQYHDENLGETNLIHKESLKEIAIVAKETLNERLKLNTTIDIDIKFGYNYSETH